jgi:hypothetical protein
MAEITAMKHMPMMAAADSSKPHLNGTGTATQPALPTLPKFTMPIINATT